MTAITDRRESLLPLAAMLIVVALPISAVMEKPEEALNQQNTVLTVYPELPALVPTSRVTREQATPAAQAMVTEAVLTDMPPTVPVPDDAILRQVLEDELPSTAAGLVMEQTAMLAVAHKMQAPPMAHEALVQDFAAQHSADEIVSEAAPATDVAVNGGMQTGASRATEIGDLIAQGRKALEDNRLLTPALDSAYYYFQSTLKLDPDNAEAREGIEQIVARYVLLTNKAFAQRERMKANRYIARGLSLQPDNSELLALKNELQVASDSRGLEGDARSQVEDPRKRTDNVFILIKSFFANNSKARPEVLVPYQKTSSYLYE